MDFLISLLVTCVRLNFFFFFCIIKVKKGLSSFQQIFSNTYTKAQLLINISAGSVLKLFKKILNSNKLVSVLFGPVLLCSPENLA